MKKYFVVILLIAISTQTAYAVFGVEKELINTSYEKILKKNNVENIQKINTENLHNVEYVESLKARLKLEDIGYENFDIPVHITTDEQYIYNNENKIQGIFVHWHLINEYLTHDQIVKELKMMKALGIKGIATELPWARIEVKDNKFEYPKVIDDVIEEAQKQGMWVTLLLSPHYTPRWIYLKYGDKVKIKDQEGHQISSNFMTFSVHSPVVIDQINFQRTVTERYAEKFNNILAFYLTNEPGYNPDMTEDYSYYAIKDWRTWCKINNISDSTIPYKKTDKNYTSWQRFKAEGIINYLNRLYTSVKTTQTRFIPLSHKITPYFMLDFLSPEVALHPTHSNMKWDIATADIYNFTPSVYGIMRSFRKPIIVAETNSADSYTTSDFFKFLIMQYFEGSNIQTIFKWHIEDNSYDMYDMFDDQGHLKEKLKGIQLAANIIDSMKKISVYKTPEVGAIIPNIALIESAHKVDIHQEFYDTFIKKWFGEKEQTDFIFTDEILEGDTKAIYKKLNTYKKLYFNNPGTQKFKKDIKILNSPILWDWIKKGGKLYLSKIYQGQKSKTNTYGKGFIQYCELNDCTD